jgi:hypothetical protein
VNKWADPAYRAEAGAPARSVAWNDPDKAVLEHMREILGIALFDGCGQPDCFDCAANEQD